MLDFRTVTVAEESGTFFIGSQCLCIFTHNGMNHCHFQGGYFLGTDFCFAYLRGEVVVDIKVVEHLFIDTVDTPDTLDYPCGVVRYIIVENSSSTVQVVTLGNGIGGNQYLVIIGLRFLLHTCVKVIANGLAHRGSSICAKGTELFLTVSMGVEPEVKVMENLIDVTEEEARAFLEGQGFQPLCRYESSSVYEDGRVIRTDPAYGAELKNGQTINLWISTGPKTVFAKMPNVVGMTKEAALKLLAERGFTNVVTLDTASEKPKGEVISQSTEKNAEIDVNTEIRLEISEGPEPSVDPTADTTKPTTGTPTETTTPTEPAPTRVTFSLPVRTTTYYLTILQNETVIVNNVEIAPGSSGYEINLFGSGTVNYDLYIDGEFYQTQRVEF